MSRPKIPRALKREVLVEAGHRCAIPTCRHTTVEIAHIQPYSKVKEHTFDNLIALCPNCHTLQHEGKIDRKSLRQYKANLAILTSRYSDFERRVLSFFAEQPNAETIILPGGTLIFLWYLLKDGYLQHVGSSDGHKEGDFPNNDTYRLTTAGREFVQKWLSASKLD